MATLVAIAAVAVSNTACGGSGNDSIGADPQRVETPAVLTGQLDVSVEEGPVGDDEISEVNFGALAVDDGFVLVQISAATVRSAGLSHQELIGGGRFRVDLSGESEYTDPRVTTYVVSELELLD